MAAAAIKVRQGTRNYRNRGSKTKGNKMNELVTCNHKSIKNKAFFIYLSEHNSAVRGSVTTNKE